MAAEERKPEPASVNETRRSLLKKSAVVGGVAMWATPLVQSFRNAAHAQDVGSLPPPKCPDHERLRRFDGQMTPLAAFSSST